MIDKDLFKEQILAGFTIKELQEYWNCSRTSITDAKKKWNLIGLSPNSKKRDNGDGTKTCNSCGIVKHLKEYYSNGYTTTGSKKVKGSCIPCENKNRYTNYYNKIIECLTYLNREYKCTKCGYNKNYSSLVFHHYTSEKNFEIGSNRSATKEELIKEISICEVLCQNCHHETHNPHLNIIV